MALTANEPLLRIAPPILEAGLDDSLAKPFEKADLAALLARGACEKLAAARREHEISAGAPL